MKEAVPLEVAEYAVHHNITSHHVFVWWVPQALKHKEKIIKQVSYRLAKKQYKFGIYVPNSVDKVLSFDKENNDSLWHGAIQKEFLKMFWLPSAYLRMETNSAYWLKRDSISYYF